MFKKIASICKEKKLGVHEMSALRGSTSGSLCGSYCPSSSSTVGLCCQGGYAYGFGTYYLNYFPEAGE